VLGAGAERGNVQQQPDGRHLLSGWPGVGRKEVCDIFYFINIFIHFPSLLLGKGIPVTTSRVVL
jgi:hypothetical protein